MLDGFFSSIPAYGDYTDTNDPFSIRGMKNSTISGAIYILTKFSSEFIPKVILFCVLFPAVEVVPTLGFIFPEVKSSSNKSLLFFSLQLSDMIADCPVLLFPISLFLAIVCCILCKTVFTDVTTLNSLVDFIADCNPALL